MSIMAIEISARHIVTVCAQRAFHTVNAMALPHAMTLSVSWHASVIVYGTVTCDISCFEPIHERLARPKSTESPAFYPINSSFSVSYKNAYAALLVSGAGPA